MGCEYDDRLTVDEMEHGKLSNYDRWLSHMLSCDKCRKLWLARFSAAAQKK